MFNAIGDLLAVICWTLRWLLCFLSNVLWVGILRDCSRRVWPDDERTGIGWNNWFRINLYRKSSSFFIKGTIAGICSMYWAFPLGCIRSLSQISVVVGLVDRRGCRNDIVVSGREAFSPPGRPC